MGIDHGHWNQLKPLAGKVFASSLHFTIATTNHDGTPHVTPIGSLVLADPGEAYFCEAITRQLSRNLDSGSPVAVLGVISSSRLWFGSLIAGQFSYPPAFRLLGNAKRAAFFDAQRTGALEAESQVAQVDSGL